eukprot:6183277-Pleurochrysis_carterae.AAC.1
MYTRRYFAVYRMSTRHNARASRAHLQRENEHNRLCSPPPPLKAQERAAHSPFWRAQASAFFEAASMATDNKLIAAVKVRAEPLNAVQRTQSKLESAVLSS